MVFCRVMRDLSICCTTRPFSSRGFPRYSIILPFLLLALLPAFAKAQDDREPQFHFVRWDVPGAFPGGARDDMSAFAVDGFGYAGCGIDQGYELRNDWWRFDPRSVTWEEVASLPGTPRQYATAFASAGYGYLVGGIDNQGIYSNEVFRYDPATNSWTELMEAPFTGRASAVAFRIGRFAYYGGGRNDSLKFNDFWRFDTESEHWERLADLPFAGREEMIGFGAAGEGYILLGRDTGRVWDDMFQYDPLQDTWSGAGLFPGNARTYACAVAVPGGAVVCGGMSADGALLSEVYHYNALQQGWQRLPDQPVALVRGMEGFRLGNAVYFCGGLTSNYTRIDRCQRLEFGEEGLLPVLELWPVPTASVLNIYIESDPYHGEVVLDVADVTGRYVVNGKLASGQYAWSIPTDGFPPGIYYLRLTTGEGESYRSTFIVDR